MIVTDLKFHQNKIGIGEMYHLPDIIIIVKKIFCLEIYIRNTVSGNTKKFSNFSSKKCDINILYIKIYRKIFRILYLLLEIDSQEV